MKNTVVLRKLGIFALAALTPLRLSAGVQLDTANPQNGVFDIYSATFDAPLTPCTPTSDPKFCPFFKGFPAAARAIKIVPAPTGVLNGVPGGFNSPPPVPSGFTYPPAAGSSLNLTLSPDHTQVTLAGGTVAYPKLAIVINQGTPQETSIVATGAGTVFRPAPVTVPVDANGVAVFEVDATPNLAADFSTLNDVLTVCTGPLCSLVRVLTLDMVRYRMVLDYDATFGSFTASFIGQTGNNSMVFANLLSGVPKIAINSTVPPPNPQVTFGSVTVGSTPPRTVTVTNDGTGDLVVGTLGQINPLAAPFAIASGTDVCSNHTLAPGANCTFEVVFSPGSVTSFSDSLDIPSNDAANPSVTVDISGSGVPAPVPNITVSDSVAPAGDRLVPFGSITVGASASQTVTVTNSGTADLVLQAIGTAHPLSAPFSIASDTCSGQTLVPNGTCNFVIDFNPAATSAFVDSVDIPSNDPDESSVTFNVTGTGAAAATPNIQVTDDAPPATDLDVQFGNVVESTTLNHSVAVTNTGGADLHIGTVGVADPLAAPFSVVTDGCSGQRIAPGASCVVVLRFSPTALASAPPDSFDIPSDDPDTPVVTVMVHGTGIVPGGGPIPVPTPEGAKSGLFGAPLDPLTLLVIPALAGAARRVRQRPKRG